MSVSGPGDTKRRSNRSPGSRLHVGTVAGDTLARPENWGGGGRVGRRPLFATQCSLDGFGKDSSALEASLRGLKSGWVGQHSVRMMAMERIHMLWKQAFNFHSSKNWEVGAGADRPPPIAKTLYYCCLSHFKSLSGL